MEQINVQSSARSSATADQLWAVLRDFCAPWHPAIASMRAERTATCNLIRRFTVKGEETVYREQLIYFSDSDRCMRYTHLEGIADVDSYTAELSVAPDGAGSVVTLRADLSAAAPRAQAIAAGTQAIFDMGTQALAAPPPAGPPKRPDVPETHPVQLEQVQISRAPRLALTASRPAGDTLCLFLHGIGGNRTNWDLQLQALAAQTPVAALDLRGYGDSDLGPTQSSVDDYCTDILQVMQARGVRRLILCGLSYGAWIATSFAMRYPEKLDALILSGGCTGMSEATDAARTAFRKSRETPLGQGQTPADFAASVVDVISGPNATQTQRSALHASMAAIPAASYADALHCFTHPPETFDFAKLTMPILLITGEHDRLAPPSEIRSVAQRISKSARPPDVRFEVLAGAGHVCNVEQPRAYNAILSDFMTRILP